MQEESKRKEEQALLRQEEIKRSKSIKIIYINHTFI